MSPLLFTVSHFPGHKMFIDVTFHCCFCCQVCDYMTEDEDKAAAAERAQELLGLQDLPADQVRCRGGLGVTGLTRPGS